MLLKSKCRCQILIINRYSTHQVRSSPQRRSSPWFGWYRLQISIIGCANAGEAAPLPSNHGPRAAPDREACTHAEQADTAEPPMKAESTAQPESTANAEEPGNVEQAAAADEPAKGSKRKAGASLKQPSGKPRAKWRNTEVGAVPAAQAGLRDMGAAEIPVTPGMAEASCFLPPICPKSVRILSRRQRKPGHPDVVAFK